jgi:hypothetical protein
MVAAWARTDALALTELGLTPDDVAAAAQELADDLFEVWQPFATRFAALARGDLPVSARELAERPSAQAQTPEPKPGRQLPLLGH